MDYVYICRSGKNEELRYSLRSLEHNMPEGRVWLFGYRPEWYIGDFVRVEDIGNKFDNIKHCLRNIINNDNVSDNFVLMNDDFFALKKINSVENFYGGLLDDKIQRYKELRMSSKYIRLLELTCKQLKQNGVDNPLDYDIHVPITINKNIMSQCIDIAYFPRSTYGNFAKLNAKKITDVKIYGTEKIKNNFDNNKIPFISTEDNSFNSLKEAILNQKFDSIGKYENPMYSI